jgi:ABC-type multidrug transport system ATPase subunit
MTTPHLLSTHQLTHGPIQNLTHQWPAGVSWVCGDEGCGKTTLLRLLAGDVQPTSGTVSMPAGSVFWANLQDAVHDQTSVNVCWTTLRQRYPNWQDDLQHDLTDALGMTPHLDKRLNMLSAGSRRKVTLIAALASGATVTLLDQPFAALDTVSIQLVLDFLHEASDHTQRAWIVADYEVPNDLRLADVLNLSESSSLGLS